MLHIRLWKCYTSDWQCYTYDCENITPKTVTMLHLRPPKTENVAHKTENVTHKTVKMLHLRLWKCYT